MKISFLLRSFRGTFCCALLVFSSCAVREKFDPTTLPTDRVVIFVPGHKGSTLRDETGRTVWLDTTQLFYPGDSLALRPDDAGLASPRDRAAPHLTPHRTLSDISAFLGLLRFDIYGESVRHLRRHVRAENLIEFVYDWREDMLEPVKQLDSLIRQLRARGIQEIILVGHSMGGMVISYYLRYGTAPPESAQETWFGATQVDRVILAGVPFRGSITMFKDMLRGSRALLNRTMMSAGVMNTYPSNFQLLPLLDDDTLLDSSGRAAGALLRDAQQWEAQQWGLFNPEVRTTAESLDSRRRFVAAQLTRARAFLAALSAPTARTSTTEVPLLYVTADNRPTRHAGLMHGAAGDGPPHLLFHLCALRRLGYGALSSKIQHLGDGTVTSASAALPEAFTKNMIVTKISTEGPHHHLLAHRSVAKRVRQFIKR